MPKKRNISQKQRDALARGREIRRNNINIRQQNGGVRVNSWSGQREKLPRSSKDMELSLARQLSELERGNDFMRGNDYGPYTSQRAFPHKVPDQERQRRVRLPSPSADMERALARQLSELERGNDFMRERTGHGRQFGGVVNPFLPTEEEERAAADAAAAWGRRNHSPYGVNVNPFTPDEDSDVVMMDVEEEEDGRYQGGEESISDFGATIGFGESRVASDFGATIGFGESRVASDFGATIGFGESRVPTSATTGYGSSAPGPPAPPAPGSSHEAGVYGRYHAEQFNYD